MLSVLDRCHFQEATFRKTVGKKNVSVFFFKCRLLHLAQVQSKGNQKQLVTEDLNQLVVQKLFCSEQKGLRARARAYQHFLFWPPRLSEERTSWAFLPFQVGFEPGQGHCALLSIQTWMCLQAGALNHCPYSMSNMLLSSSSSTGDMIHMFMAGR